MGESADHPPASNALPARWWRDVSRIDAPVSRLLTACAGGSLLLCLRTYLPFYDPYFLPPFPAAETRAWNFFALIEHSAWSAAVFLLGGLAGGGLILGRRPRVCAALGLLVTSGIAVAGRPLISTSLTVMSLLLLYLALFPARTPGRDAGGLAVFGLRLQVMLIYLCGSLFKLADPAWLLGYPLGGALRDGNWSSALGEALARSLPQATLNLAGQLVLGMELVLPLAAFVLFRCRPVRLAAALLMMALHTGMALCMTLEFFPFVMIALWTSYLDRGLLASVASAGRKWCHRCGARLREGAALLLILLTLYACLGQVFLPALGHERDFVDRQLRPINRQIRFNQHWGMFTHASFRMSEDRADPRRNHVCHRLLVRGEDGSLWDPFRGKASSVRLAYSEGSGHLHAGRKGLSYSVKTGGGSRDRALRTLARWAIDRARQGGLAPQAVMIYRYTTTLDYAASTGNRTPQRITARLWYRLDTDSPGEGEVFHPGSVRPIHFDH